MIIISKLPIICMIQGAIVPVETYVPLHFALSELGYMVTHPVHPTIYTPDLTQRRFETLQDDAANAQTTISRLVETGQEVVVVAHSYGGHVAGEAITESMSARWRSANGLPGGIVHLYMISAGVVFKGDAAGKEAVTTQDGFVESTDGQLFTLRNNEKIFYNDSPLKEAKFWASLHRWMSFKSLTAPTTNEGWRYVDTTFLITANDLAYKVESQAETAASIGAKTEQIYTGHFPWLTQAEEVAARIDALARKASKIAQ